MCENNIFVSIIYIFEVIIMHARTSLDYLYIFFKCFLVGLFAKVWRRYSEFVT